MFKVLIVEDDRALRQLFSRVLMNNGYTAKGVTNGQEALDALGQRLLRSHHIRYHDAGYGRL